MIIIKICGIICEYNPLHKGHIYQLEEARRLTEADYVVCIMSGNFVQRGENAVFDKFARAEAALESGADAVFELPQIYALQSAEYFAYGGVQAADSIGCTHLCFGSECGDLQFLSDFSEDGFKESIEAGESYGTAKHAFEGEPNNMLGREYLKALSIVNKDIVPVTLKRDESFYSASKLRDDLRYGVINDEMYSFGISPLFFDKFFDMIKYKIISMPLDKLRDICGVNEGLENKLKKEIYGADSIDSLIHSVKSKRYTYTRISRILCNILLDITDGKLDAVINDAPKLKLLGIRENKGELLSMLNNYYISPLDAERYPDSTAISNDVNILATEVYSILTNLHGDEDYTIGLMKV